MPRAPVGDVASLELLVRRDSQDASVHVVSLDLTEVLDVMEREDNLATLEHRDYKVL